MEDTGSIVISIISAIILGFVLWIIHKISNIWNFYKNYKKIFGNDDLFML